MPTGVPVRPDSDRAATGGLMSESYDSIVEVVCDLASSSSDEDVQPVGYTRPESLLLTMVTKSLTSSLRLE